MTDLSELRKLIELCVEKNVAQVKFNGVELILAPQAFAQAVVPTQPRPDAEKARGKGKWVGGRFVSERTLYRSSGAGA